MSEKNHPSIENDDSKSESAVKQPPRWAERNAFMQGVWEIMSGDKKKKFSDTKKDDEDEEEDEEGTDSPEKYQIKRRHRVASKIMKILSGKDSAQPLTDSEIHTSDETQDSNPVVETENSDESSRDQQTVEGQLHETFANDPILADVVNANAAKDPQLIYAEDNKTDTVEDNSFYEEKSHGEIGADKAELDEDTEIAIELNRKEPLIDNRAEAREEGIDSPATPYEHELERSVKEEVAEEDKIRQKMHFPEHQYGDSVNVPSDKLYGRDRRAEKVAAIATTVAIGEVWRRRSNDREIRQQLRKVDANSKRTTADLDAHRHDIRETSGVSDKLRETLRPIDKFTNELIINRHDSAVNVVENPTKLNLRSDRVAASTARIENQTILTQRDETVSTKKEIERGVKELAETHYAVTHPDTLKRAIEEAADKNIAVERFYERRHEVRTDQADPISNASSAATASEDRDNYQSISNRVDGANKPYLADKGIMNKFQKQLSDSPHYKSAIIGGAGAAIALLLLLLLLIMLRR